MFFNLFKSIYLKQKSCHAFNTETLVDVVRDKTTFQISQKHVSYLKSTSRSKFNIFV